MEEDKNRSITPAPPSSTHTITVPAVPGTLPPTQSVQPPAAPAPPSSAQTEPKPSKLLSPISGVRLAWALTSAFPKQNASQNTGENADASQNTGKPSVTPQKAGKPADTPEQTGETADASQKAGKTTGALQQTGVTEYLKINTNSAETILTAISTAADGDQTEKQYIRESIVAIRATMRNLATIYSARELNIQENNELRKTDLESIKQDMNFGNSLKDYTKSIPTSLATGGGGLLASAYATKVWGISLTNIEWLLIFIIFGYFGLVGFWIISKIGITNNRKSFIRHDYERGIYFENYLTRASIELKELHRVLVDLHKMYFPNAKIEPDENTIDDKIRAMFAGVRPATCVHIDDCINKYFYDWKHWVRCETKGRPDQTAPAPVVSVPSSSAQPAPAPAPVTIDSCPHSPDNRFKAILPYLAVTGVIILILLVIASLIFYPVIPAPAPGGVSLIKSPDSQTIKENQTVDIHVVLKNLKRTEITDISIEDTIPAAFVYTEGNITKTLKSLGPGESGFLNYSVRSKYAGNFTILPARAVFADSDGNYQEITSNSLSFKVLPSIRPSVSKSVRPDILGENQTLVVTVMFENNGMAGISNLTITDKNPEEFTFVDGNTSYNAAFLKSGESRSIQYSLKSVSAGKFILDPAIAQYSDSSGNNITITSNSPEIQVLAGFISTTADSTGSALDLTAFNSTELLKGIKILMDAFPSNITG